MTDLFAFRVSATKTVPGKTMSIPLDGQMKFIRDVAWKNTIAREKSGQAISVPTTTPTQNQWISPENIPLGFAEGIATL